MIRPSSVLFNLYPGKIIFVLGTSDSLKEHRLERLQDRICIGVNDALRIPERLGVDFAPEYLLTVETSATDRALPYLKKYPWVNLLTRSRVAQRVMEDRYEGDIFEFEVAPKKNISKDGTLSQVNNTAHYAVEMAARMLGFRAGTIALLGVDLRYPTPEESKKGKQNHFWGDGMKEGCRPDFDTAIKQFPNTVKQLQLREISLVTCSSWPGPLKDCLIHRDFDQLIDESRGA